MLLIKSGVPGSTKPLKRHRLSIQQIDFCTHSLENTLGAKWAKGVSHGPPDCSRHGLSRKSAHAMFTDTPSIHPGKPRGPAVIIIGIDIVIYIFRIYNLPH